MAVQDGDQAFFDALVAMLRTSDDETVRERLVSALASPFRDDLATRARALALDPVLHTNEVPSVLWRQAGQRETRDATWTFLRDRYADLLARLARGYRSYLPRIPASTCDADRRAEIASFFGPRVSDLTGGRRNLALALEGIDVCVARKAAQSAAAQRWLESR